MALHLCSLPVTVPLQTGPDPGGFGEDTRLSETSPDAQANGRERMLYQAWSNSAGHFVVQRLRVSSGENMLLQPLAGQQLPSGGELSELSW